MDVDPPAPPVFSSSLQSIITKLDALEYCSPTRSGTSLEDVLQATVPPIATRHMRSLLNITHSEGESDKRSMEPDSQSLHTPGHVPNVTSMRESFSVLSLDPQSSAYNYSLGSREYVQLHRWHNGTSGSKTTTLGSTATIIDTDGEAVSTSTTMS